MKKKTHISNENKHNLNKLNNSNKLNNELEMDVNNETKNIYLKDNFNRKDIYFFMLIVIGIAIVFSVFAVIYQKSSNESVKVIAAYGDIGCTNNEDEQFSMFSHVVAKSLQGGMWELSINGTIAENTTKDVDFETGISIDKINDLLNLNLYDDSSVIETKHIIHSIITSDGKNIRELQSASDGTSNTFILNSEGNVLIISRYFSAENIAGPWSSDYIGYREGNTIDATLILKEK